MTGVPLDIGDRSADAESNPERRASWLDLFFDLCFVVAVGAVAATFHADPTSSGFATFVALFIPVWWAWMEYAWYATVFVEADIGDRLAAFAAMFTILAMAAQVDLASSGDPRGFILAFVAFYAIVILLYLRASRRYPERREFARRRAVGFIISAAFWLASLAVGATMQLWFWAVGLFIGLLTPFLAPTREQDRSYDLRVIPERYGLFTLIVLGEAIIAVARGTAEAHWTPAAVVAAVSGFVIAVVIWWAYFAHNQAALLQRSLGWAFSWGYGHIFVWAGIAMTGVGIELAIEAAEASHGFSSGSRLILCGGIALYFSAMALLRAADTGRLSDRIALVRIAAATAILVLGILGGALSPEAVTIAAAAIVVVAVVVAQHAWRAMPEAVR